MIKFKSFQILEMLKNKELKDKCKIWVVPAHPELIEHCKKIPYIYNEEDNTLLDENGKEMGNEFQCHWTIEEV